MPNVLPTLPAVDIIKVIISKHMFIQKLTVLKAAEV